MHAHAFDQYHYQNSFIHDLVPTVKVVVVLVYIFSNALLPDGSWLAFAMAWLLLLIANDLSNLGLGFSFKRSFVVLPFSLVAVTAIFSPIGQPLAEWDLGFIKLVPTDFGLVRFLSILVRSWLSVQMAILLVSTTQFPDMIHAFEHLRVPRVLTTIVAFLYRYLFVLTDEVFRLLRARDARSAGLPGKKSGRSVWWRAKVTGSMAGQLFLRTYERSERISNAMVSRGYTGHIRTLKPHAFIRRDWLVLIVSVIIIMVIQVVGWF
jgi:cobalt/nickel transport system permease protein